MMLPYDIPILTRTMAQRHFLLSGSENIMPLTQELLLDLDSDIPEDSPTATVASYLLDWWTTLDPDCEVLSDRSIMDALDYHATQSASRPLRPNPGPPTAASLNRTQNKVQSYSTFYEHEMYRTSRRAAGFFMLSEAAARKTDDPDIPPDIGAQQMSAEVIRSAAENDHMSISHFPPARRAIGVTLTAHEAVEVFSPERGTRDQDRTDELTDGDIHSSRFSSACSLEDGLSDENFSSPGSATPGPPDLGPDDFPQHFQTSPLRTVGSDAPFRFLGSRKTLENVRGARTRSPVMENNSPEEVSDTSYPRDGCSPPAGGARSMLPPATPTPPEDNSRIEQGMG